MNKSSIIIKIKDFLEDTHKQEHNSISEWTFAFKKALRDIGIEEKFKVYPDKENMKGEWLFDLCWTKERDNWKTDFKGLILACEIEWSRNIDDIIYDFQKLTVVDSEIRLLIFQYNTKPELKKILTAIGKACDFTRLKKFDYLIAATGNKEPEICFFEICEQNNYQLSNLEF